MKTTIFVPDIECDSCVKILSKAFKTNKAIEQYIIKQDHIIFTHEATHISPTQLTTFITNAGFRASLQPFARKTFKERIRDFRENPKKYALERKGIKYSILTFALLLLLGIIAHATFLNTLPNFLATYGWWLLYLILSTTFIGFALWHVQSYKANVTCMVGMMIGMTFGMQTGMMIGAIIGATNGFFIGAMTGMLLGVFVGAWTGKCCGVMGVMEGMMAGLMGGTMGSMISVMMFFDHLLWFMPVYMFINIIILLGLSYMLFEEVVEHQQNIQRKQIDFFTFSLITIIVTVILATLMIYGPQSTYILGGA